MKAALILGPDHMVTKWQYEALRAAVADGLEISVVAHCADKTKPQMRRQHLAYYVFAVVSRRAMTMTKQVSVRSLLAENVSEVTFESEWQGIWQRIPETVASAFASCDVAIKFGMNLLRDPESLPVPHGVMSYHHGNPRDYRGRPAGFYELLDERTVQGVIVQRLSNRLDGGRILAEATAQVVPHSYAGTLDNAYRAGIPLLAKALKKAGVSETADDGGTLGKNYRLPTNGVVALQASRLARNKVRRLAYGLFREKIWNVARLNYDVELEAHNAIPANALTPLPPPRGYTFTADPFVYPPAGLVCEALNSRTGRGEIFAWSAGEYRKVELRLDGAHASYPQVVKSDDGLYIFPEIASSGRGPSLFRVTADGRVGEAVALRGLEDERVLDGTLHRHDGSWYLFGGRPGTAAQRLELWVSSNLTGPFETHPASPVCLDPRGARMAGALIDEGDKLYRVGQDGTHNYGGRIAIHRIESLTPTTYREVRCGSLQLNDGWGPHTFSRDDHNTWVDYYRERSSLMAGVRRLRSRARPVRR